MDVVDEAVTVAAPTSECGAAAGEPGWSSPSPAASPEFEFWMVGKNPSSFQSPALLTADELFSDGIVLPLRTLQQEQVLSTNGDGEAEDGNDAAAVESSAVPEEAGEMEAAQRPAESGPAPTPDLPAVTFKWKDIFKATGGGEPKDRKKMERRMERRVSSVGGNGELININIWPFSRSRSAGHSAGGGTGTLSRNKSNPNANANANASNAAAAATAPAATVAPAARKDQATPSVSTPAAATTGCRNNVSSCSEAGGEEGNPPQGLFGLRTFFSKKVY
ncbi:hypothetical protein E2562_036213 [Oryza meyeriana var. granulata]|uniref:Uncharacterized protein n=1 Tax=Oryza meyeriana var. granulata TaxID=110450 RepID=A0A6G1ET00_9ORYZ|nr:hypothetical protein E2562_036213 [Oryza meyeriana var. granulata]